MPPTTWTTTPRTALEGQPRIDKKGAADGYLLANNMMQEVGPNHLAGDPYKLDT
jgi:thiosulfate reductase / polysulfide reductase chain A